MIILGHSDAESLVYFNFIKHIIWILLVRKFFTAQNDQICQFDDHSIMDGFTSFASLSEEETAFANEISIRHKEIQSLI